VVKQSTNLKIEQGQRTYGDLLTIAGNLFAKQGYAATTTEEIIHIAGVTKGALYHHFSTKRLLFEAVYVEAEQTLAAKIDTASSNANEPWEQLMSGCYAYLEACSDPDLQQILRIDGPSVLGLVYWRKIDQQFGFDRLLPFLEHLSVTNVINVPSVTAFVYQLTGAMNEATFWIAQHSQRELALEESKLTLRVLLQGVRVK